MKKFVESLNTAVFTTKFIIEQNNLITEVYHDREDGAWQFLSNDSFNDFENVAMVVSLGEILEQDSTLIELAEMPKGYFAVRDSINSPWIIKEYQV